MASEIKRDVVIGNFRKPRALQEKRKSTLRQSRPGMSEEHLALIRQLPCCICGRQPAGTVHHLKQVPGRERGMTLRSTDRWGVPMCMTDHEAVERIGSKKEEKWFFDNGGFNAAELALALWAATGDLGRMLKVLLAHKGGVS